MKGFIKKTLAVALAIVILCPTLIVGAAFEFNEEAVNKHYGQFENYLLLGDSVASGYRDEISDNDAAYNEANNESTYWRVPGSYADVLANTIIEDKSMTALAAPGFRTIEMRYMMEDDFAATCEDEYLFHTSHLYVYEDEVCSCHGVNLLPGSEHFRDEFKKSIAEADLITLGVGGNDWGAYLGWVIADILEQEHAADKYIDMVAQVLRESTLDVSVVEKLVSVAEIAGALPALVAKVPAALDYGLSNFYTNWDIMIQDIYELNPDVTLMVLGMSDNSLKGKYFDYNGVPGEAVNPEPVDENSAEAKLTSTIVDFIMSVGNKPMIDGAEKFGYIYVDTDGTSYVDSHPDADGHCFIANRIIEELPDPAISKKFEDVTPGHKHYKAIEYVVANGIMEGTSETTFSPDKALTVGELNEALGVINGSQTQSEDDSQVSALKLAITLFSASFKKEFLGIFKGLSLSFKVLGECSTTLSREITRAEAAYYLAAFAEI